MENAGVIQQRGKCTARDVYHTLLPLLASLIVRPSVLFPVLIWTAPSLTTLPVIIPRMMCQWSWHIIIFRFPFLPRRIKCSSVNGDIYTRGCIAVVCMHAQLWQGHSWKVHKKCTHETLRDNLRLHFLDSKSHLLHLLMEFSIKLSKNVVLLYRYIFRVIDSENESEVSTNQKRSAHDSVTIEHKTFCCSRKITCNFVSKGSAHSHARWNELYSYR